MKILNILLRGMAYTALAITAVAILIASFGLPLGTLRTALWAIGLLALLVGVKYASYHPTSDYLDSVIRRPSSSRGMDEVREEVIKHYERWKKYPLAYKLRFIIYGLMLIIAAELLAPFLN